MIERIGRIIEESLSGELRFPPTEVYCEGWLLRLVIDWVGVEDQEIPSLRMLPGAGWFSEVKLPSRFLARHRGDPICEGWTTSDAVVGHVSIREDSKTGLVLESDAAQLTVIEAKVFSSLSGGITNAGWYDQAARTVACMADLVRRAERSPADLDVLEFLFIAPESELSSSEALLTPGSIQAKVARRVDMYREPRYRHWLDEWFAPLLQHVDIRAVSWEGLCDELVEQDEEFGAKFTDFYRKTLRYN